MNPNLPIVQSQTLEDYAALTLVPQRVAASVSGSLGIVGLLLAAIGIYGVTAYMVSSRTREIGIRVALGARRGDVVRMVLRQGMMLALAGMAIGLVLAAGASRLLGSLLFGIGSDRSDRVWRIRVAVLPDRVDRVLRPRTTRDRGRCDGGTPVRVGQDRQEGQDGRELLTNPGVSYGMRSSAGLAAAAVAAVASLAAQSPSSTRAPRLWTDKALAGWALPIAGVNTTPSFYSETEYDAARVDELRTYPSVRNGIVSPTGYREWMRAQGPQPLIEIGKSRSDKEWISAGRDVFDCDGSPGKPHGRSSRSGVDRSPSPRFRGVARGTNGRFSVDTVDRRSRRANSRRRSVSVQRVTAVVARWQRLSAPKATCRGPCRSSISVFERAEE